MAEWPTAPAARRSAAKRRPELGRLGGAGGGREEEERESRDERADYMDRSQSTKSNPQRPVAGGGSPRSSAGFAGTGASRQIRQGPLSPPAGNPLTFVRNSARRPPPTPGLSPLPPSISFRPFPLAFRPESSGPGG